MNSESEYINLIALSKVPGLGPIGIRKLLTHFGSASALFDNLNDLSDAELMISKGVFPLLKSADTKSAKEVYDRCMKSDISMISILEDDYPPRLKSIPDPPPLLYYKGSLGALRYRPLGIVGTRKITEYGRKELTHCIQDMVRYAPTIISGLAFGTDIAAHELALTTGLKTIAVLANGLDSVYPHVHKKAAERMVANGGALISEAPPGTSLDARLFPVRNRIIAGLCDAVIVVESALKGGSMITANLAFGYDREVYALPGRVDDLYSKGCNALIAEQKASIFLSVEDVAKNLRWNASNVDVQIKLFEQLDEDEQKVVNAFDKVKEQHMDTLLYLTGFHSSKLAGIMLNLQLKGIILSLPGSRYSLIR